MFMKSTLPVREWYGIRPPPDSGMVGFKAKYSNTRAPELIPLTICSQHYRTSIIDDKSYFGVLHKTRRARITLHHFLLLTCPKRIEILASDLSGENRYKKNSKKNKRIVVK